MINNIYIAITVSIIYILLKLVLEKTSKNKNTEKDKTLFRDSFYIAVIVFVVLYGYDYYFTNNGEKTKVFTNEPDF